MKISLYGNKMTNIGIYAVNHDVLVDGKDEFFQQLYDKIAKVGKSRGLLFLGVINSRVGSEDSDEILNKYGKIR